TLEEAGARIFEHTPALSIDPSGVRKRVITPSARLRAAHVVLAGNTGLGALMPELAATLMPITTYVAVTAPLGPQLTEAVAYAGAVSDTEIADNHYRIVDGDRLMWSGGVTMWAGRPRRFARRLAADIRRTFPQLADVAIDSVWSGTLGRAVHSMPQVGEVSRGLWIASGFGGHGLNTTAVAGELVARGIVESDQAWRLFSLYDLTWAGGWVGRAVAQVIYWSRRSGDLFEAQTTRRRPAASATSVQQEAPSPPKPAAGVAAATEPPVAPVVAVNTATERTEPRAAEVKAEGDKKQPAGRNMLPSRKERKPRKAGANGKKRPSAAGATAQEPDDDESESTQEAPAER
ncbi:MAG: FAD-dependent oxidoreductase, partial [Xanthobacteraceae bacterium]